MITIVKTNKEARLVRKRKRAPGGGRKSQGPISGKTHVFTTRISADTRQALEREAAAAGQSISQMAETILKLGINRKRETERDRPMRALFFLIEQFALNLSLARTEEKALSPFHAKLATEGLHWRTNPFIFRSLQSAISQMMDHLAPSGALVVPRSVKEYSKYFSLKIPTTPEQWADNAGLLVWIAFQNLRGDFHWLQNAGLPPKSAAAMEWLFYGYSDARRDLEISEVKRGEK
jgi:hypothetical protein